MRHKSFNFHELDDAEKAKFVELMTPFCNDPKSNSDILALLAEMDDLVFDLETYKTYIT